MFHRRKRVIASEQIIEHVLELGTNEELPFVEVLREIWGALGDLARHRPNPLLRIVGVQATEAEQELHEVVVRAAGLVDDLDRRLEVAMVGGGLMVQWRRHLASANLDPGALDPSFSLDVPHSDDLPTGLDALIQATRERRQDRDSPTLYELARQLRYIGLGAPSALFLVGPEQSYGEAFDAHQATAASFMAESWRLAILQQEPGPAQEVFETTSLMLQRFEAVIEETRERPWPWEVAGRDRG